MTSPIATPKDSSRFRKGIEIRSHATEKLREQQIKDLQIEMKSFYERAGLADLLFLHDVLITWEMDRGTPTHRSLIADIVLESSGRPPKSSCTRRLRYRGNTSEMEGLLGGPSLVVVYS